MDDKYLSDDVREALVLAEEELKPKPPRIPCSGKQMRKLWRAIARRSMKERGFTRINAKRRIDENGKVTDKKPSFFAMNWSNWCYNS